MQISITPRFAKKVALAMFITALVLTLLSFTADDLVLKPLTQLIVAISSLNISASKNIVRDVLQIVNVNHELNIPTWFSASVLLLNSVLLAAISSTKKAVGDKYVTHWWGLSIIFLILSMDEIVGVHDRVNYLLSPVLRTSGIFTYFWVIPGSAFVLLFLLAYLRFFFALPTRVKWLFLGAGVLYVGGALGLEMVLGYMESMGDVVFNSWKRLEVMIEELLEMTGAIVFFYALTGYCEDSVVGRKNTQLPPSN